MGFVRMATSLALALLLGCATSPASAALDEAEKALAKGEYERAYQLYEVALSDRPGDRLVMEKAALSRQRAAMNRLDSAYEAEDDGDLDGALAHLEWAMRYAPEDARIAREKERIEAERSRAAGVVRDVHAMLEADEGEEALRLLETVAAYARTFPEIRTLTARANASSDRAKALRLTREGETRLAAGDALAAHACFGEALALEPELEAAAKGRETARRAAAARFVADADERATGGQAGAALAILEAGRRALGESDPDLAEHEAALRFEIRERLRMKAEQNESEGRFASAIVLLRAAAAVDARFDREIVEAAEAKLGERLVQTVRVEEFEDETGGRADPELFASSLEKALAADPPGPWIRVTAEPGDAALVVSGAITSVEVEEAEPVVEKRVHEHLARVEQEPNPERARLEAMLGEQQSRLADAEEVWEADRDERESLERLEGSASVRVLQGDRGRFVGPYSEAAYYRILGNSRARESRSRQVRDRFRAKVDDTRRRLEATPYYLEKQIFGRTTYEAVTRVKQASASAEVRVTRDATGTEHAEASASIEVKDTTVHGIPAIELPDDPDEMPSDVGIAGRVLEELAVRVAGIVGQRAVELRRSLIDEARERERAGDEAGALDRYAAFALTAGSGMEIERANACGRILRRFGIDLSGGDVDVRALVY